METQTKIDSRLIPECFAAAGLDELDVVRLSNSLAEMLCARAESPLVFNHLAFKNGDVVVRADVSMELLWDGVSVRAVSDEKCSLHALLQKYSQTFDEAIQQKLKFETGRGLLALNDALVAAGTSLDSLRRGLRPIEAEVARTTCAFYVTSIDRVIHEEIVGLLIKPVREHEVRVELGSFLLAQFSVPAKRVQRVNLCQSLENLACPELVGGLSKLALDKRIDSLRGRLCSALAKCGTPEAANVIASVLDDCDDETKVWAIEALGTTKATQFIEKIRGYSAYQSTDKEWTRAINKAAEKVLKKLSK